MRALKTKHVFGTKNNAVIIKAFSEKLRAVIAYTETHAVIFLFAVIIHTKYETNTNNKSKNENTTKAKIQYENCANLHKMFIKRLNAF